MLNFREKTLCFFIKNNIRGGEYENSRGHQRYERRGSGAAACGAPRAQQRLRRGDIRFAAEGEPSHSASASHGRSGDRA